MLDEYRLQGSQERDTENRLDRPVGMSRAGLIDKLYL